ncbi:MAG: 30S ribosomal protein S11 [Chitinophagales bacterium]|jgi:small subunit ribosomal protein S11|nr:30S ribosomal protein S11 [Bacteroidota bacterium]MBX7139924.1 30S ribosomal protein S11 [Chitinophagales bacterium]
MAEVKKATKKRTVKAEPEGHVHIQASFNNIIITFTNKTGQTISWSSAGKVGFKGSKKNTPYAAQIAAQEAAKVAHDAGMRKVEVFVKGPGSGREAAIRAINTQGIDVSIIRDVTPLPHNGCRPAKRRRV